MSIIEISDCRLLIRKLALLQDNLAEIRSLSTRTGLLNVSTFERASPELLWQAVLEAALRQNAFDDLIHELRETFKSGGIQEIEDCLKNIKNHSIMRTIKSRHPELGSISHQVIQARTAEEVKQAGFALRTALLDILQFLEIGSGGIELVLSSNTPGDAHMVAERLRSEAASLITAIDIMLDLAEMAVGASGSHFAGKMDLITLSSESTDSHEHVTNEASRNALEKARKAREPIYHHTQRLLASLTREMPN